jgi:hypothetical protein
VDGDLYVYGVTRAGAEPPNGATGIEGGPARLLPYAGLAAIVSPAPDGLVKPSRRNLTAHTSILREAMEQAPVLPMRFGVVMPPEAVERELLEGPRARLEELLERLEGTVELELKVVFDEEALLRDVLAGDERIRRLRDGLQRVPSDAAYYDRIRLGELVAEAVEHVCAAEADRILGALVPLTLDWRRTEELPERVALKAAFLVEASGRAAFETAAEAVAAEAVPRFRCQLVGPLPPFSFVELDDLAGAGAR